MIIQKRYKKNEAEKLIWNLVHLTRAWKLRRVEIKEESIDELLVNFEIEADSDELYEHQLIRNLNFQIV